MFEENTKTFTGHNFKADYRFTIKQHQKANGEIQLEELTVRAEDENTLINTSFDRMIQWWKVGKEKRVKLVSPFEAGYEPV